MPINKLRFLKIAGGNGEVSSAKEGKKGHQPWIKKGQKDQKKKKTERNEGQEEDLFKALLG